VTIQRSFGGSEPVPPNPPRKVRRVAVVTHGKAAQIGSGLARLQAVAAEHGVELLVSAEEAAKHGVDETGEDPRADLAVVLGGDGTVLRALTRFLGTGVPVVGVNFGRVGFLSSIGRRDLELGLGRVFEGEYDVVELPTLELEHPDGRAVAVNDVVVTSAGLGRMIELELAVGGEELGRQPCDGIICSTPSGSTAYNLSNGGPVLMWGLEAIALTYVAAHSLRARPLVIPPGADVIVWNRSADVEAGVLVDGHRVSTLGKAERAVVRIADERSLLATLPEATFVRRYRQSFAS
jgi:NAD+ kinase